MKIEYIILICIIIYYIVNINNNKSYFTNVSNIKFNYVVNLDRRPDRYTTFLNTINKSSLINETFIRFSAFDGSKYQEEFTKYNLNDHQLIKKLKEVKLIVPKGVFGCMMSHLLILESIRDDINISPNDFIGIYEDDIILSDSFEENYKKLQESNLNDLDIELLYLGGRFRSDYNNISNMYQQTSNPNIYYRNNHDQLQEEDWCRCTFSYVIRKSACDKLINCIIDDFLTPKYGANYKPIDHIYTDAYLKIRTFDFFPHLYYGELNQATSDIQNSNLNNVIEFYNFTPMYEYIHF